MKIYVATSWRNEYQPTVVQVLRNAGHEVYDFRNPPGGDTGFSWRQIDPDFAHWTVSQQINAYDNELAEAALDHDTEAMAWADAFVMVQPCGRSAALELGWAIGAGKTTMVLMAEGQEPELMLRMADHLCLDLADVLACLDHHGSSR